MLELVLRLVLSLGVVLGLFWVVARTGSRRLGGGRSATLKVRGRQSLGRTAQVAVVEVGSRVLVVGVGEGGVRLLTELDPEELEVPVEVTDEDDSDEPPTGRPAATISALGGSLLAPQTWKQAWAAATAKSGSGTAARAAASEPAHD